MLDGGQVMHNDNIKLRSILAEAKFFHETCKKDNRPITWSDYEYFKNKLHVELLFGYEGRLADILGL